MILHKYAFFLVSIVLLTGCIGRQAFFVSPFNGINNPYHSIPTKKDSLPSAFYVNGALAWGNANDNAGDKVFAAYTNLSQGLNFGKFQAFYGIGIGAGSYRVDTYGREEDLNETVNAEVIDANAGRKTFGGYGFDGGINYTISGRNNEWRMLGVEMSLRKEYGQYLSFRERLPPGSATVNIRNAMYGTAGAYTEFIHHALHFDYGFKVGVGRVLNSNYHRGKIRDSYFIDYNILYNYFDIDFHVTKHRWTGYIQYNDACKASVFMMGANYRLGKR
ncbi:MAG: hypothetical protein WKF70_02105 [Chitinophagaceae bacterium]